MFPRQEGTTNISQLTALLWNIAFGKAQFFGTITELKNAQNIREMILNDN